MTAATFVEQCLEGVVDANAIDGFVVRWHGGEGGGSLPNFLGFSDDEYALWVERPAFLPAILAAKRLGLLRELVPQATPIYVLLNPADPSADAIVVEAGPDPVGRCRTLWSGGELSEPGQALGEVPPLVACVSTSGVIEVYPGNSSTCGELGLVVADPSLSPESQAMIALEGRIVEEINDLPCVAAIEAAGIAQRIVDTSELDRWTVSVRPDSENAPCAKAAVDVPSRTISIVKFP